MCIRDRHNVPNPGTQNFQATKPNRYWEIQLAWSEYKNGKWLAKKVSPQKLIVTDNVTFNRHCANYGYHFKAMEALADLRVDVFGGQLSDDDPPNESANPRHVAAFVLSGTSVDVKQRATPNGIAGKDVLALKALDWAPDLLQPVEEHYENEFIVHNHAANTSLYALRANNYRLDNGKLLGTALIPFALAIPHQDAQFDSTTPFFYQDQRRTFYITPTILYKSGNYYTTVAPSQPYGVPYKVNYRFQTYYHPYVPLFIRELNRFGIDGLLKRTIQTKPESYSTPSLPITPLDFQKAYTPTSDVTTDYPKEDVDLA